MSFEAPAGKGLVKWVSTKWLEEHLEDDNLQIVDVQPDVHDYFKEHIPGSRYMCEKLFRVPLGGLPAQYIPADAMQQILRRVGLRNDTPVVLYTATGAFSNCGDGLEQTMAAYTLARFGHNNIYILDGGLDKWKAENRPLDQEFPQYPDSDFQVQVRDEYIISYQQLREIKNQQDVILLDNRPPGIYKGKGPWKKQGHIPDAVNLPWQDLMDSANTRLLKSDDEIREIAQKIGATPDKTVICSCGTGREATDAFIVFKWLLDYPKVKLYEGSFTEWMFHDQDTVRGSKPW